jgi:hypothetical protein
MQGDFETMRKQVEIWQRSELTDVSAKIVIYEAFSEGKLEAPKHLARTVHNSHFKPKYEEFQARRIWSPSNTFTPSRSLGQQRSSENFLEPASRSRSKHVGGNLAELAIMSYRKT